MNIILKTIAASCLLLASCRQQKPITESEIKNVINRFDSAWKSKSERVVDSVLSRSYVYFTQSGGTFSRSEVVRTAGSDEYRLNSNTRKIISWKAEGTVATVNTLWIGEGVYRGLPFSDTQRCSLTLLKKGDTVQILSEHCTLINKGNTHY